MIRLSLAAEDKVQQRVAERAIVTAKAVASENAATANHDQREKLAFAIFNNDPGLLLALSRLILTNPTIASAATTAGQFADPAVVPDADIDFEMASIWTMFALARFGR